MLDLQLERPSRLSLVGSPGFFSHVLENDLLKVNKILGVTFFRHKKTSKGRIQNNVFPFNVTEFCGRKIVYNSCLFA